MCVACHRKKKTTKTSIYSNCLNSEPNAPFKQFTQSSCTHADSGEDRNLIAGESGPSDLLLEKIVFPLFWVYQL